MTKELRSCWGDVLPELPRAAIERARAYLPRGWGYGGIESSWNRRDRERWIYFLQGDDGGPIKIGHTITIRYRSQTVNCGYPFGTLRHVGLILGTTGIEKTLHERFAKDRIRGEWFKPSKGLVELVHELPLPAVLR